MQLKGKFGRLAIAALALASVAGGLVFVAPPASAQAPVSVPVARFYGRVRDANGGPVVNWTITASVGAQVCSGTQANVGGSGTSNDGTVFIDIQAIPGCTTPGSTVVFTASLGASGTVRARQTGTIPDLPGTAVHLDLDFPAPATPTPAAPPPPPPAPPTTVRPSTSTVVAPPPTTVRPATATPVRTPVVQRSVQQAPKGPVSAQGPKVGAGGAAGAGGAGGAGGATAPRLPNTGTGGLLDQQSSSNSLAGWALALIVLAALGVSASGLMAYRRSR
jgi:hypothetical protein